MAHVNKSSVSGKEVFFKENEIIVSKTDLKGRIQYANKIFIEISGYTEPELILQPHSILRHPDMPRCIFRLLWENIQNKKEIFAYVVNRTKNGDHYWVLAHVTPSLGVNGEIMGFHSNRRVPDPRIISNIIIPLYKTLSEEEQRHANAKEGLEQSTTMLKNILKDKGLPYDEFIFSLAA